jgi:hypothetical protein
LYYSLQLRNTLSVGNIVDAVCHYLPEYMQDSAGLRVVK